MSVGKTLIEGAYETARTKGRSKLLIDVHSTDPAVAFYKAMNMQISVETAIRDLNEKYNLPSRYRMAKDVDKNMDVGK
jgi:hypothetical protein